MPRRQDRDAPYGAARAEARMTSPSHPGTTRMRGGGAGSVRTIARNRPSAATSYGAPYVHPDPNASCATTRSGPISNPPRSARHDRTTRC